MTLLLPVIAMVIVAPGCRLEGGIGSGKESEPETAKECGHDQDRDEAHSAEYELKADAEAERDHRVDGDSEAADNERNEPCTEDCSGADTHEMDDSFEHNQPEETTTREEDAADKAEQEGLVSGSFLVEDCRDSIDEPCFWRYRVDRTICPVSHPCSKLLILFSGGDMGCDDPPTKAYKRIFDTYTSHGFVAVCAGIFMSKEAAGMLPYNREAMRVDILMRSITGSSELGRVWSGEHLLISGASHGASAPVIAMARTDADSGRGWHGTVTTAVCMYDGMYDAFALDKFLLNSITANGDCKPFRERAICDRYLSGKPDYETCLTHSGPAPKVADMYRDTVVAVPPEEFAVTKWKLIECGSSFQKKCGLLGWDMFPRQPIEELCAHLDGSNTHDCVFDSMPDTSHLLCPSTEGGIYKCLNWFDSIL
ncbi:MAG: hypothetical protein GXP49_09980 [Deltaproteobacteria bacterium]|nr:hypothetical protein [Deltaproteobacteria bacterium]